MNTHLKLILVEDNPGDADLIREMLSQTETMSFEIVWVTRLSEAIHNLGRDFVNLVLLDLNLPDSDGLDTLRAVREAVSAMPIVVLTGNDDEKTGISAVQAGAQDYLVKSKLNRWLLTSTLQYAVERKKTETELRESEARFKGIFDHTNNGITIYKAIDDSNDFIIVDVNKGCEKIENIRRHEAIGKPVSEVFAGIKKCGLFEVFQRVWSTGKPEKPPVFYYEGQRTSGWRDNYVYKLPTGEIVAIYTDETERIRAEQALAESEERYRTAIEYSNDGIAILKGDIHVYVNPKYLEIFGYAQAEEILNRPSVQLVHPDDRDWVREIVDRRAKNGPVPSRYECRGIKKNGDMIFIEVSIAQTSYQGDTVTLAFFRDISQRRKAEAERILLAAAIEHASESVLITDLNGSIQYVNPICEKISGYTKEELIGQNPRILQSGKDDRSFYQSMWANLEQGSMWKGHFVNRRKDGSLYEEDATISPVINAAGKITHYVAVKRDVTDEIRREKQLRQAQKMEAIGTLAGGIAHDFNNILSAVIGYSEIALDKVQNDEKLKDHLQEILNAGVRARDLVKQILTFSRQTEQKMQPVQIKLIVKEVLKLLRASLPATIEIRPGVDSDDTVIADPTQIHQILMNLCTNAAHAMRENGGLLSVSLKDILLI